MSGTWYGSKDGHHHHRGDDDRDDYHHDDGGKDGGSCTPPPPPDCGPKLDGYVEGTAGADLIDYSYTGDPEGDRIDHNDAILGGEAPQDDIVLAGAGNDTVKAGEGNDDVYAGRGDDQVSGGRGNDRLFGEDGNDTLSGDDGCDTLDGGCGDDSLDGGAGNDKLVGGSGNDTLNGGAGQDYMAGGDDRDLFTNLNAGDTVFGGSGGDDWDTLDLTGAGKYELRDVVTDSDGNGFNGQVVFYDDCGKETGHLDFDNIEKIVPCFTPGTRIATPTGERLVEELRAGDRIITRDDGIQEIRWVGSKRLSHDELQMMPHLRPVLIRAGALGHGLPERDMLVSPNHRMLVANDRTSLLFEEREVLVAAKHLVGNEGVERVSTLGTNYIHFMFDRHEVVLSDGAWTESFQPGDYTLGGIGNAQRNEILELFPDLERPEGIETYAAARRTLKRHEARLLLD